MIDLRHGDCLEVMRTLADASVDAVVTDPPAGIAFMGKAWDRTKSRAAFIDFLAARLAEALRVAKPGAHLLCWAIPRTSHWTGTAIEDAGWVIEDRISHLFGSGFPKHKSKLKPACEDWWLATKPGGTKWLNVDGCKIGCSEPRMTYREPAEKSLNTYGNGLNGGKANGTTTSGRWPANVVLDEEAAAALDEQAGPQKSGGTPPRRFAAKTKHAYGTFHGEENPDGIGGSAGNVSRFYYCAKASKTDRGEGNTHPTVKSTNLMRWLCRLVTPQGGIILDPFAGSGSTGKAAMLEGFGFVGIESDIESFTTAERRVRGALADLPLFASGAHL